jgi:hypothetical protein
VLDSYSVGPGFETQARKLAIVTEVLLSFPQYLQENSWIAALGPGVDSASNRNEYQES